jgi:hypothetical protein
MLLLAGGFYFLGGIAAVPLLRRSFPRRDAGGKQNRLTLE